MVTRGLLFLIFFFLADDKRVTCQSYNCDVTTTCPGQRPRDSDGCCLLLPGDSCNADGQLGPGCDEELGVTCSHGICKGPYNLRPTYIGDSYIKLAWWRDNTARGENCTVLYSTILHEDEGQWNAHKVGYDSNTTIHYLEANTWYFVRVKLQVENTIDGNSETILVRTKARVACLYDGHFISVGDQILVDCKESCVCTSTGYFHCVPVCSNTDMQSGVTPVCTSGDTTTGPETGCCGLETTQAAENTSCCLHIQSCIHDNCTYLGDHVQHGYSWTIDCAENCTCYNGEVTCVPLCDAVTSTTLDNCSHSVMSKTPDGCCDVAVCNDTDVCEYGDAVHKVDTWFSDGNCAFCRCPPDTQEETTCIELQECLGTRVPAPSAVCPGPIVADNHCCQQIVCETQTDPRYIFKMFTVSKNTSSSIIVRFQFISSKDEAQTVHATLYYTHDASNTNVTSWTDVTMPFSDAKDTANETLDLKHGHLNRINNIYVFTVGNMDLNKFYYIRFELTFHQTLSISTPLPFSTPTWVVTNLDAESNKLASRSTVTLGVIKTSSITAFLSWDVPETMRRHITSFLIRYKSLASRDWTFTERLIFTTSSHTLTCLYTSRWYELQLLAYPDARHLATAFFNTSAMQESSDERFQVRVQIRQIHSVSVTVRWHDLPRSLLSEVVSLDIYWTFRDDEESFVKACVSVDSREYTVYDLQPATVYRAWIAVNLVSGSTVFSDRVYFVTSAAPTSSSSHHNAIVAITGTSIALVVILVAVVTVAYIWKFKRRATYHSHTAFENRIFQIYSNKDDREL